MQHKLASDWIVVTLSAEQAVIEDRDEDLTRLLERRTQLLDEIEAVHADLHPSDWAVIRASEERLKTTIAQSKDNIGRELRKLTNASQAVAKYRAA